MNEFRFSLLFFCLFLFMPVFCVNDLLAQNHPEIPQRLPSNVLPVLGCWFWQEREFEPEGYKDFIDLVSERSPYNLLTTSLRIPIKELTDRDVRDRIQSAAEYARERGVSIVMDLDVRLARRAFQKLYPDELQQMLILQEAEITADKETVVEVKSRERSDHYTHRTTPYIPLQGSLMRVYSYRRNERGIDPTTLVDITARCRSINQASKNVIVGVPARLTSQNSTVCVMAAFTHLTPDVFAPHLLEFQRRILQDYEDAPFAGACKDEWGFPPCFDGNPAKDEFWYSSHRSKEYAKQTGGRDLLFDCLLMSKGMQGRERERIAAVNHFMEMSRRRNGEIECDFYDAVKEIWGQSAMVATHPTWWPYPDAREFKKNGLDWWIVKRDWAQTDETTPFAVRTSLAKKWNSPLWYNMFYDESITAYETSVWTHALAGGRINYHPLWPRSGSILDSRKELLQGDLMRAESRIRLLNFIARTPIDCPVAVVFGHPCAMNWAGSAYNDVGMDIANALWQKGYPTDLIPSSEIENNSLFVNKDGWIQYGPQRYAAVILFHPEFEKLSTGLFFQKAARGQTALFCTGEWTRDFDGSPIQVEGSLPKSMQPIDDPELLVSTVCKTLRDRRIETQTPATGSLQAFGHTSVSPSTEGFCRLIDGTQIWIAGTKNVAGDSIQKSTKIQNHQVKIEATGIAAVRLDREGKLDTLAAGALKRFTLDEFEISLQQPTDFAVWKDRNGNYHGVVQNQKGSIPEPLLKITRDWRLIRIP